MTIPTDAEHDRLLRLDSDLHAEADRVLGASGLGPIIRAAGFGPVGSYPMGTMTWRDLDFERLVDRPDWDDHWALGAKLAGTGWVWRASCMNAYRDAEMPENGHYWGLRISNPLGGTPAAAVWKLDLWTGRPEEWRAKSRDREHWRALMTPQARLHVLAIKESVCHRPEYRMTMLSVHIYEAVLDRGVKTADEFERWWRTAYGQGG